MYILLFLPVEKIIIKTLHNRNC